MKCILFILLALCVISSCRFKENTAKGFVAVTPTPVFEDLRSFASIHFKDKWLKAASSKVFHDFDFEKFVPVDGAVNPHRCAEVFYNENNEMIQIVTSTLSNHKQFGFRFLYPLGPDYPVYYVSIGRTIGVDQPPQVPGFFIYYRGSSYFVSYGHAFCIMKLSRSLRVQEIARFMANELTTYSIVRYKNDTLYSESFYKPNVPLKVTKSSTLEEVLAVFSDNDKALFSVERRFGGIDGETHQPLWINGCHQEWDFDKKP